MRSLRERRARVVIVLVVLGVGTALFLALWPRSQTELSPVDRAIREFEKGVSLEPENERANNLLANAYEQAGRLPDAIDHFEVSAERFPAESWPLIGLGRALMALERHDEALLKIEQGLEQDPDQEGAYRLLAEALQESKDLPAVVSRYREGARRLPDDGWRWGILGLALLESGARTGALDALEEAVSVSTAAREFFHMKLIRLYREDGEFERAVGLLQAAAEADTEQVWPVAELGSLYRSAFQCDDAMAVVSGVSAPESREDQARLWEETALIHRCLGEPDRALEQMKRAAASLPNSARLQMAAGAILRDRGNWEEAIAHYRRASELPPGRPEYRFLLAQVLREAGRLKEARSELKRIVVLVPAGDRIRGRVAREFEALARQEGLQFEGTREALREDRSGEAIENAELALEVDPTWASSYHLLSQLKMKTGGLEAALAVYRRALEANPNEPWPHIGMARLYREAQQVEKALSVAQQAFAISSQGEISAEVFEELGLAYEARGEPEEAVSNFKRAVAVAPDAARSWALLANALREQGNLEESLDAYRRAASTSTARPVHHFLFGRALWESGEAPEALEQLTRAIEEAPDTARWVALAGEVLAETGETRQALAYYRQAVRLASGEPTYRFEMAVLLQELGQLEEAERELRLVMAEVPPSRSLWRKAAARLGLDPDQIFADPLEPSSTESRQPPP